MGVLCGFLICSFENCDKSQLCRLYLMSHISYQFTIESSFHTFSTRFDPFYMNMYLTGASDGTVSHYTLRLKLMGQPLQLAALLKLQTHFFHQIRCTISCDTIFYQATNFFWQFFQLSNFFQRHIFANIFLVYKILASTEFLLLFK